jgi:hypothetical protein
LERVSNTCRATGERAGKWRNGLRSRLKSDRTKVLVGSNPTFPTTRLG